MDLTPSLAFTALLELSEDWRAEPLDLQRQAVARLTEDYEAHLRRFRGTTSCMTFWAFARVFIKYYYRPDE